MTTRVLQFAALPERDLRRTPHPPRVAKHDRVEVRVRGPDGKEVAVLLPPQAAELVGMVLERLFRGEKVAVLADDQEVTPNEVAAILGMSRPLVVHRMDVGDLPFRYVGKHRRARLVDVLALKGHLEAQHRSISALAEDTDDLTVAHGL